VDTAAIKEIEYITSHALLAAVCVSQDDHYNSPLTTNEHCVSQLKEIVKLVKEIIHATENTIN